MWTMGHGGLIQQPAQSVVSFVIMLNRVAIFYHPHWGLEYSRLMAFVIIFNSHNALVSIWTSRFYLWNNTLTGYRYHWSTSSQTFLSRNLLYPNGFKKKLRDRCSMRLLLWSLQNHAIRNVRVWYGINVETMGENVCNEERLTVPLCFIKENTDIIISI